jgi:hypothetical protein
MGLPQTSLFRSQQLQEEIFSDVLPAEPLQPFTISTGTCQNKGNLAKIGGK